MRPLIALSAVSSALLFAFAAAAYPGGSHFDRHAVGHDFWRNALCDVARATALNGAPNARGAVLAQAAMSILALGIGLFLWALARKLPPARRLVVRILTALTVPAALAVVFLPTDRFSDVHGLAVVVAGVFGTAAATIAVTIPTRERWLGLATLAASFLGLGIYSSELVLGGPPRAAVPVFEHLAAILLLAWMLLYASRRPRGSIASSRLAGEAAGSQSSQPRSDSVSERSFVATRN